MVGLVQKLLFDLIESSAGADAACEVRRRADVPQDKEFHINEVYDDVEWRRLFSATLDVLNLTQEQAEEADAAAAGALNFIQGSVSTLLSTVILGDDVMSGMDEMGMDGTMMSDDAHDGHGG